MPGSTWSRVVPRIVRGSARHDRHVYAGARGRQGAFPDYFFECGTRHDSRPLRQISISFSPPSDFRLISMSPEYPQIIYLHGSVDHYTDQNIEEETKRLNPELVEKIYPLLRDHPLVMIGYRGGEASIVQHLLLDQVKKCSGYRRGIYWCHRKSDFPEAGVPLLAQLRATLGSNFSFVQIDGFDELMVEIAAQLPDLIASSTSAQHNAPISASQLLIHA